MRFKNAMLFTLLMCLSTPVLLAANEPVANERSAEEAEAAAREYFTDTILVTQDGEEVRFFTDVLKDQVVAINFIFTHCLGACPMITERTF